MSGVLAAHGTSPSVGTGDWRDDAACVGEDPELFFPIGNTGSAVLQIEEAKAVCRRCDVVESCLRWALDTGQDAGVWGGLAEDERRALKRRNSRAASAERRGAPARDVVAEVVARIPRPVPVPAVAVLKLAELLRAEGRTWQQIATQTGLSAGTLRDVHSRGRKSVMPDTEQRAAELLAARAEGAR